MPQHYQYLLKVLKGHCALSDEKIAEINGKFRLSLVEKGEIFLQAGEICDKIFFVAEGLIRSFHLNPNGSEFTRVFVKEGGFCTILVSFNERLRSPASFQALENSVLLEISAVDFRSVLSNSPDLQKIYLKILEDYQNFQIRRIEILTQYSPRQRVEIFHQQNADLLPRLAKKHIASYLQMTPETYSRNLK